MSILRILFLTAFIALVMAIPNNVFGQTSFIPKTVTAEALNNSILYDHNGDGQVTVLAFGDSIVRGVGDFEEPGSDNPFISDPEGEAGFPLRLEQYTGVSTLNRGHRGERLSESGVARFVHLLAKERPDIAVILEGANDAMDQVSSDDYFHLMQTVINMAYVFGVEPVIVKLAPVTENHSGLLPFIESYNHQIDAIITYNNLTYADVYQAFVNTCSGVEDCYLLNLPEGLHPNIEGYDVIGEMVTASLLKINLLDPTGPALLEQALSLAPGSIKTVPNQVTTAQ